MQVTASPGSRKPSSLPTVFTLGQVTVALSSATVTGPARRDVARVRDQVAVGDHVTDRVSRSPATPTCPATASSSGRPSTVSVSSFESILASACRRHVGDRAVVQVGLRDRVRRGAGDRLARIEEAVVVADRVHARAADRRLVVGHRDRAGETDVAGVGDQVAVGDHVADRVVGLRRRGLVQRQLRVLVRR